MTCVFDPQVFSVPRQKAAISRHATPFTNVHWDHDFRPPTPRARGVKKLGLNYERRVLDVLSAIYERAFTPSPVIAYMDGRVPRRACRSTRRGR